MSRTDFCIEDPSSRQMPNIVTNTPNKPPSLEPFTPQETHVLQEKQLGLYWEPGYFWQEEHEKREWCMMFDYDGLPGTGKCWYEQEARPCNPAEIYIAKCNADRRQKLDIVLLLPSDGKEDVFMIRVPGKEMCLELQDDRSMQLRECDTQSEFQLWKTINGRLDRKRFEIVPLSLPSHCVTQDHQPKAGEVVRIYRCELPRGSDSLTSFWQFY